MPYRAGFWIRTLATAIDVVAILLVAVGIQYGVEALLAASSYDLVDRGSDALLYIVWLAYTSMETWLAATPGKMVLRLRVSNADCTPADFWRLFLRWSTKWSWLAVGLLFTLTEWSPFYLLSGFVSGVVVIGCFFAANDDRLAWHDQWAHTAVCRVPRGVRAFDAAVPPPLPAGDPPPTA